MADARSGRVYITSRDNARVDVDSILVFGTVGTAGVAGAAKGFVVKPKTKQARQLLGAEK